MLSESDPKLYTNFEFLWRKNHRHWKNILIYNAMAHAIYDDKNNSKKIVHILEDNASVVQVCDIEQVTI